MNKIILKPGKDRSVFRFHPWIFSGAIANTEGNLQEGNLVKVYNSEQRYLATGHCQIGSIAVRILTFEEENIDYNFWKKRIENACQMRKAIGITNSSTNNVFRLIHGEGDHLPGLIVDYYAGVAVVQFHTVGMFLEKENITRALREVLGNKITAIYNKSESTLPYKAAIEPKNGYLYGKAENFIAIENGVDSTEPFPQKRRLAGRTKNRLLYRPAGKPQSFGKICKRQKCTEHVLLHRRIFFLCHARRSQVRTLR